MVAVDVFVEFYAFGALHMVDNSELYVVGAYDWGIGLDLGRINHGLKLKQAACLPRCRPVKMNAPHMLSWETASQSFWSSSASF
jgi:hypothetical protein